MKFTRLILFTAVFAVASSGCVSSTIQQVRQSETGIGSEESIAILSRRHKTKDEARKSFIDCVSTKTSSGPNRVSVVTDSQFVDALFPWFEPRTAPLDLAELNRLVARPEVAQRFEDIGVRYIVWVDGSTERRDQSGALQCAVATGGIPACFGFLSWEGAAEYEATIWDIPRRLESGKVSSESSGVSFVPAVIVPLPFIARVQAKACTTLADRIKTFITGY